MYRNKFQSAAFKTESFNLKVNEVRIAPLGTPFESTDWILLGWPVSNSAYMEIRLTSYFAGGAVLPESGLVELSILDLSVDYFLWKLPHPHRLALLMYDKKNNMSYYSPACSIGTPRQDYFLVPKPMNRTLRFDLEMFDYQGLRGLLQWTGKSVTDGAAASFATNYIAKE